MSGAFPISNAKFESLELSQYKTQLYQKSQSGKNLLDRLIIKVWIYCKNNYC